MRKYEYREEGCDRCDVGEIDVVEYSDSARTANAPDIEHLCQFCYETHLGNILQYPRQYPGLETLARGLIQSLHIVMKARKS